jgi:PAS domain-containing protein
VTNTGVIFISPFTRCRKPNWLIGQVEVSVCPIPPFLPHSGSNFRCCKAQIPGINLLLEKVHMKKKPAFFVTLKRLFRVIAGNQSHRKENHSLEASAVDSITQIKKTEQKLKESEEKYSSLFEQALDGFGISDFNGKILDVSQGMCRISGYSKEELLQMHVTGFIDPEDLKTTPLRLDLVKNGERVSGLRKVIPGLKMKCRQTSHYLNPRLI